MPSQTTSRAFPGPRAFRAWLERHHAREGELLVRCFKSHAAALGVTYLQALDEALCFGWIDGVRHGLDQDSFTVRFSPRKARSRWSAANTRRAQALLTAGRMRPAGLEAFGRRAAGDALAPYSYESRPRELAPAYLRRLRANTRAARFFDAMPPGYRRTCAFWVMSAKQEATRLRRLEVAIAAWTREEHIPPLKGVRSHDAPPRRGARSRGGRS